MSTDTFEHKFTRSLPVSPDQAFHLVTDAQMRGQWNSPDDSTVMTVVQADTRVGGIERHRAGPEDAPDFEAETRWYRLDGPSDAVHTETIFAGGATIATSLVTYRISPSAGGSTLDVTVAISSFVGPDAPAQFHAGWDAALTNLARLAQTFSA